MPRVRRRRWSCHRAEQSRLPRGRRRFDAARGDRQGRAQHRDACLRPERRRHAFGRAGGCHRQGDPQQLGAARRSRRRASPRLPRTAEGRSRAGKERLRDLLRLLPWRRRAWRATVRLHRRRIVPGAGERSVPAHAHHRRPARVGRARLARRRAGPAHDRAGSLRRRGLARFPAAGRSGPTLPNGAATRRRLSMSSPEQTSRRGLLVRIGVLVNMVAGVVLAVPIVRYLLSPASRKRKGGYDSWLSLGSVDRFPVGETRLAVFPNPVVTPSDGATGEVSCWVRNVDGDKFQVFAINCAHLGCPVRWFAQSNLFMCPCHGGAYYADGARASGPPERGLFEYRYKVEGDTLFIEAGAMPTPGGAPATLSVRRSSWA